MDELLRQLLDALDEIAEDHEEIYDTVCRERMGDPVFHLFIKPNASFVLESDLGLFSEEGNRRTRAALLRYVREATSLASRLGVDGFHSRLAEFQNNEVRSGNGNYYDDYFGWMNPASFDELGNVVRGG